MQARRLLLLIGVLFLAPLAYGSNSLLSIGSTMNTEAISGAFTVQEGDAIADDAAGPALILNTSVCDLTAIAFANPVFNNQALAQARCNQLIARTNSTAANCKAVRLNNGKFRAQFRRQLKVNQLSLGALVQEFNAFVLNNNFFADAQIAIQAAVSNGCG